jgi:hypothetical protein
LGPSQSGSVVIEWRWQDNVATLAKEISQAVPTWPGWALILALLVLVKENRKWQAWLILIPFLLLSEILWAWVEGPFVWAYAVNLGYGDVCEYASVYVPLFHWVLVAWTMIWLLSPWLARCRPRLAAILALSSAAVIGAAASCCVNARNTNLFLLVYGIPVFATIFAFTASRLCCRKVYGPWRFLAWLPVWLIAGVAVGLLNDMVWRGTNAWTTSEVALFSKPILASLRMGAMLYLLNLSFMVLVFACPLYHDRFCKMLRLSTTPAPLANPPSEASLGEPCELA